jgi:hypothetical protein
MHKMARVSLPQSKIKARRRKRRIVIASSAAVGFLLVFLLLVWISHLSFMRIDSVEVSGVSALSQDTVKQAVLQDVSGDYLFVFPKNNIFLYPKAATQASLVEQIPTIAKVTVEAKTFHTLSVTIVERARKALWCGTSTVSGGACFWLDQDGVAYSAATDLSLNNASSTYKQYFGALTGSAPQQFITPDEFHALSALIDALSQNQQFNPIQSVAVDPSKDVRVSFINGFALLFSLDSAGADVYQRFVLALGADAFQGHTLGDFEYLDLRFGDKLYYKLRDNQTPTIK